MEGSVFPAFLKLGGRRVLVVGGGTVAAGKVPALLAAGAKVTVVAPQIGEAIRSLAVERVERGFESTDLDGAWFVVAAATPEVNRAVAREAEIRRVFVNAVDDPSQASAYLGGVVRRAGVTLAISTDGAAPALAGLLREGLDALLPQELEEWTTLAKSLRAEWKANAIPMHERRPLLLQALVGLYSKTRTPEAR